MPPFSVVGESIAPTRGMVPYAPIPRQSTSVAMNCRNVFIVVLRVLRGGSDRNLNSVPLNFAATLATSESDSRCENRKRFFREQSFFVSPGVVKALAESLPLRR